MSKNRVLIPVDGSDFARQIFPHVMKYFPPEYNDLILLRVEEPSHGHIGLPPKPAAAESRITMYERRADLIEAQHPIYASQEWESTEADVVSDMQGDMHLLEMAGYSVTPVVRLDKSAGDAILRYVETHDVNLVAMTTHGRTGIPRMLFGSVAQQLAGRLQIPMMIVRPAAEV